MKIEYFYDVYVYTSDARKDFGPYSSKGEGEGGEADIRNLKTFSKGEPLGLEHYNSKV